MFNPINKGLQDFIRVERRLSQIKPSSRNTSFDVLLEFALHSDYTKYVSKTFIKSIRQLLKAKQSQNEELFTKAKQASLSQIKTAMKKISKHTSNRIQSGGSLTYDFDDSSFGDLKLL